MVKPRTMMPQGNILINLCPDQLLKNRNVLIKFSLLNVQNVYFSQECIELSQNDDQEKRWGEEID